MRWVRNIGPPCSAVHPSPSGTDADRRLNARRPTTNPSRARGARAGPGARSRRSTTSARADWVAQFLVELARMGCVEDGQTVDDLGVVHRRSPGGGSAPIVADEQRRLGTAFVDEIAHVVAQLAGGVRRGAVGLRRQVVAAQV